MRDPFGEKRTAVLIGHFVLLIAVCFTWTQFVLSVIIKGAQ